MSRPTATPGTTKANEAYEAHVALVQLETAHPNLSRNPYFQALRDTAYARFRAALEAQG